MKKVFITVVALMLVIGSFARPAGNIDEKLKQAFQAEFPNAQNISWTESEDAYEVYFMEGHVQTKIFYAKNNSYIRFTRYYKEENLPYQVRYIIKKQYQGKSVYSVTEASTITAEGDLTTNYFVVLGDATKWYLVKINYSGGADRVEKFRKK